MLFNSFAFLIFFPVVCILYFLLPQRFRWLFLLIASYYFYMNWKPSYAILIGISTLLTYLCGILVEQSHVKYRKKMFLTFSLVINFGILFLFKYFDFLNQSVFSLLEQANIRWEVPNLNLLLPVGISFYTFQAVGYTIDVYRGDIKAERHLGIYALFISFFPQLVAGPIERARNLLPQFREYHVFNANLASQGLKLMLWGMVMKVVVADRVAVYVNAVYNNVEQHTGLSLLVATCLFAVQIYCDFGGYSLIAVGCAKVMGYRLMNNFNRPYLALNITDFWRRWHISLSTWFKDYLYIPLGGNRVSKMKNYFNLFVTFFVSGIWHGANWTFVVWGALHGLFQVIEKALGLNWITGRKFNLQSVFRIILTFVLVDFAWIFFRANNIHDAFSIIHKVCTNLNSTLYVDQKTMFYAMLGLCLLIFKDIKDEFWSNQFNVLSNRRIVVRFSVYTFLIVVILLCGVFDSSQFIYFQF